jgi:hypothetical protein
LPCSTTREFEGAELCGRAQVGNLNMELALSRGDGIEFARPFRR